MKAPAFSPLTRCTRCHETFLCDGHTQCPDCRPPVEDNPDCFTFITDVSPAIRLAEGFAMLQEAV